MQVFRRAVLTVCLTGASALWPAGVVHAAGSGAVPTSPSAEAWHRTAPTCALPVGCPSLAPSPYAKDTLHVGVLLGAEEARTSLQLDLSVLPGGTNPVGGQLRLPVATGTRDGTRSPQSAMMLACPVTEPVTDADGSFDAAPQADCAAASAEAVFEPGTATAPAMFTVDLAPLAVAWADSAVPGALSLVPAEQSGRDSWHVAMSNRNREGEGVQKITAALLYVSAAVDVTVEPPSAAVDAPADPGPDEPPPFALPGGSFAAGPFGEGSISGPPAPASALQDPLVPPPAPQAAAPEVVPAASFVDAGFRYPAVFLLPLLFAAGIAWFGRAFTRDLTSS